MEAFEPDLDRITRTFSSRRWEFVLLEPETSSPSLVSLLSKRLQHIEPSSWPDRLAYGGIYVNGRQVREDEPLVPPVKVEFYEPQVAVSGEDAYFPKFDPNWIVYSDGSIMVVYKPPRLPSMPVREQQQFNLKTYVESYLGHVTHFPSRLDMSTQGLVVLSTAPEMHDPLQKVFEHRLIEKRYRFLTDGPVSELSQECHLQIAHHPAHPVLRCVSETRGKPASTFFKVLQQSECPELHRKLSLVEAQPVTGRTHQIRVHAQALGMPIMGDNFYGGRVTEFLHLLSYSMQFPHPLTGETLCFEAPERLMPAWACLAHSKESLHN
jgi:RluA family pseudouridine synthase